MQAIGLKDYHSQRLIFDIIYFFEVGNSCWRTIFHFFIEVADKGKKPEIQDSVILILHRTRNCNSGESELSVSCRSPSRVLKNPKINCVCYIDNCYQSISHHCIPAFGNLMTVMNTLNAVSSVEHLAVTSLLIISRCQKKRVHAFVHVCSCLLFIHLLII